MDALTSRACGAATDFSHPAERGWTLIRRGNIALAERFLEIMSQMDGSYARLDREVACERMVREFCNYYHYQGFELEIALGFQWNSRRRRHCLRSVGFVGNITPEGALELVIEKGLQFLNEHEQASVYAIQPYRMDNPRIIVFYQLLRNHAGIKVEGYRQLRDGLFLQIAPRG